MTDGSDIDGQVATRETILDAAVGMLRESGYAATTVRGIARRAGVSQGAVQHYFETKAALTEAALLRLTTQLGADVLAKLSLAAASERQLCEQLLDRLWEIHNLPIAETVFELLARARVDREISEHFSSNIDYAHLFTQSVAVEVLPTLASSPQFAPWVLVCLATMRGLVLLKPLQLQPGAQVDWPTARTVLLTAACFLD